MSSSQEKSGDSPPDEWGDLTDDQRRELLILAESLENGEKPSWTKRDILKAGGALLTGGVIGGGAHQALAEPAAASHGSGSVGVSGDPINTVYVTSINGDGDAIDVTPGFGEYNNKHVVHGGASASEINTALQNDDHVVLVGDHSSLDDRIDLPSSGVTLEIAPAATVKIADTATPTTVTDNNSTDYTPLIHSSGNNDVRVINYGTLDANDTNHSNGVCIFIDSATEPVVDSPGKLEDANDALWFVDCTNPHAETLRGFNGRSTFAAEGCDGLSVDTIIQSGGDLPAANLNGRNQDSYIGTVVYDGGTSFAVDINESPGTTVDTIIGLNTPSNLLRVTGQAGGHFTSEAAGSIGHSDDCTIKAVEGRTSGKGIVVQGTSPIRNLTLDNVNVVSSGDAGAFIQAGGANHFDGLRASGYAESEATGQGWRIDGDGNQQDGAVLDIEGVSADENGILIKDWRGVTGTLYGHDCSTSGRSGIRPVNSTGLDCNNWDVTVLATDNDFGYLNKAAATNCTIRGVAVNNASTDVQIDAGTAPYRLDMTYGSSSFNAGGAVTTADYS